MKAIIVFTVGGYCQNLHSKRLEGLAKDTYKENER